MSITAQVTASRQLGPALWHLSLETPPGFSFKAGQFVVLPLPAELAPGAKRLKGYYSVASSPGSLPGLELLVEHRQGGGQVSAWVSGLQAGQAVELEGPLGHFGLVEASGPCVFVGSGAGLAPLRSLLLHALQQGDDAWLFLAGEGPDPWLLHQDWLALAQRDTRFHYVPVLGAGPELAAQALAKAPTGARFHLAGFSADLAPVHAALLAGGIAADRLKLEKFG